jgi:hypothetical protein
MGCLTRGTLSHCRYWIFPRHLTVLIFYCCVGSWKFRCVFLSSYLSLRFQCVNASVPQGPFLITFHWWSLWDCPQIKLPFLCQWFSGTCGRLSLWHFRLHSSTNVDLEAIFCWLVENGLSLNSEKTQAMIMCRDRGWLQALLPAVLVDGRTVPYSASVKNVGLTMDNRFSWRDQVNYVRRNVGFVLSRLW